jgi:hypothetical protein
VIIIEDVYRIDENRGQWDNENGRGMGEASERMTERRNPQIETHPDQNPPRSKESAQVKPHRIRSGFGLFRNREKDGRRDTIGVK